MAKPTQTTFSEEFEPILVSAWGYAGDRLTPRQLDLTRRLVVELRELYRFRNEPVTKARYNTNKYRAGYLAAFGQRHAYLTYQHLRFVEQLNPWSIPQPDKSGELTVTILGAGAAMEVYGLCLFYNETSTRLKRLRLNLVDKVEEWKPTRQTVFGRLLNTKFPKVKVFSHDIDLDLAEDSILALAQNHDQLVKTEILVIYNVLNEIKVENAEKVWRNLQYILRQCEKTLLVLVAESNAPKAMPRVNWLVDSLTKSARMIMTEPRQEFSFDTDPVKIELEGTGDGLNDRLFGKSAGGRGPNLLNSMSRAVFAAKIEPFSLISSQEIAEQLRVLRIKRSRKGRFVPRNGDTRRRPETPEEGEQLFFQDWEEPRLSIAGHQIS